jgi:hypothetical protein
MPLSGTLAEPSVDRCEWSLLNGLLEADGSGHVLREEYILQRRAADLSMNVLAEKRSTFSSIRERASSTRFATGRGEG